MRKIIRLSFGLIFATMICPHGLFAEENQQVKTDTNALDSLLKDLERNASHKGNDPKKQYQDFRATMKILSEQSEKSVPKMIDESQATGKDSKYRCAIMQALSKTKSDSVAKLYIKNLKDNDPEIRACAASQLGMQDGIISSDALLAALDDSDGRVRKSAAYSLGQHKNRRAIEPLKRLIGDGVKMTKWFDVQNGKR